MQIKKFAIIALLVVSCIGFCGCQDNSMREQQVQKVEIYNTGVKNLQRLYSENELIARNNENDIVEMITCNKITAKTYELLNIKEKPERQASDTNEMYMFRCMHELMSKSIIDTFDEYYDYCNNISSFSDSEGNFIYKYGNAYSVESGYYSSVASNYLTQFLVIQSSCGDLIKARVYWSGGKIQEIVIQ